MKANSQSVRIALAIESLTRSARIGVVRSGRGGSAPRVFTPGRAAGLSPDDEVVARVYGPDELLDAGWIPWNEVLERVAGDLVELAWDSHDHRDRQPGPPLSILMHGPPGAAMTVLVHMLAHGFDADLVQLLASAVVPTSNGGAQPIVAPAVNRARGRRRTVLFIDQLETLDTGDRHDIRRQRAMNDLLAEALRPVYGRAPVVIAAYASQAIPPRGLTDRFEHLLFVDVSDLDDMEVDPVVARGVEHFVRTAPLHPPRGSRFGLRPASSLGSAA